VLDFASALYLGLDHASRQLPAWERLTLGKPRTLKAPPGANRVEQQLAALVGCERALLATSTLHLFCDLFTLLAQADVNIFLDEGTYPIVRWGVERAACSGTLVTTFPQHDLNALQRALDNVDERPPVIVADGYCPSRGRLAPIAEYLALATTRGGFVVVDDSQALGIFGTPARSAAYGTGGGGSTRYAGVTSDRVIIGSSLAKAFGVPVAVLAGSAAIVEQLERQSETRVHCSPPSAAVIAASARALAINRRQGDALRTKLAHRVSRFRRGLRRLSLGGIPSLFPMQPIRLPKHIAAEDIHDELREHGIEAVLHRGKRGEKAWISFILTARHSTSEIDRALVHLAGALAIEQSMDLEEISH
jgi:8-amino-7-oxononanoate synthase